MNRDDAPIIGMPAQMDPGSDQQYLSRQYSDAIAASGGAPLIIPLIETNAFIRHLINNLDGVLLTGSHSDLDPDLYEKERLDVCGPTQPLRDQLDFLLLEEAIKRKMPILAICYGIQVLNVFLGGSLVQDISTIIKTPIQHNGSEFKRSGSHEIEITPGSVLEEMAGGLNATVNSTHHQAIERLGHGLEAIAHAPDGVIEAVINTGNEHWILGVQWHPEKTFRQDEFSRKIFDQFLARCRAVRGD
jgi:putative glutamine amidotransferase